MSKNQTYANYYRKYYRKNREKILAYRKERRDWEARVREAEKLSKLVEEEEARRPSIAPGSVLPIRRASVTEL